MNGLLNIMKEREIRALRDTLKTLEFMQEHLDSTTAALRATIIRGHNENYEPCPDEVAAYNAQKNVFGSRT